jgi:hypothetical protein
MAKSKPPAKADKTRPEADAQGQMKTLAGRFSRAAQYLLR